MPSSSELERGSACGWLESLLARGMKGLLPFDLQSLFSAISGEPLHFEEGGGFQLLGDDSLLSCHGKFFHERLQRRGGKKR